jgi:hypothetical protein
MERFPRRVGAASDGVAVPSNGAFSAVSTVKGRTSGRVRRQSRAESMVICLGAITNPATNDKPETATGQLRGSVENVHASSLVGHGGPMAPPTIFNGCGYSAYGASAGRRRRDDQQAYGRWRRWNHQAGRDERVGCARFGRRRHGRSDPGGREKILPCSEFQLGEYGISELFVGVPVTLGARVEQIGRIPLTPTRMLSPEIRGQGEGAVNQWRIPLAQGGSILCGV